MAGTKNKGNRYAGKPLSPELINARTLANNHIRDERKKNAASNIEIIAKYTAFGALPLVFIGIIATDWATNNYENMTTHLNAIGGSLVGYLFGKNKK
jgi:hypothetical protein